MSSTDRIFNFSAGPAVLPEPVLAQAQQDLMALPGVGMSVLEISHRSAAFDRILEQAEVDLRAGGARLESKQQSHAKKTSGGATSASPCRRSPRRSSRPA